MSATAQSEIRIDFFHLLFGLDEGFVCIATTHPRDPRQSFKQTFFQWPEESTKLENFILNQYDRNVYFCINLLSKRQRTKENCLPTNLIWADLDEVDVDSIDPSPPILIESSPRRYAAIWRVDSKLPPVEAESYSKRAAYAFGGDHSGWDLTQLLRVPFTKNFKYEDRPVVLLHRALGVQAPPIVFESLPPLPQGEDPVGELPLPDIDNLDLDKIMHKYLPVLKNTRFPDLYSIEPEEGTDWSKQLWALINECFRADMSAEEVFVVAQSAPVNKYARDNRPDVHLWREVIKAKQKYIHLHIITGDYVALFMPELTQDDPSPTFVDIYKDWATQFTDAIEEFHELGSFIILSAVCSRSLIIKGRGGKVIPNLWGLILGDSTTTRKTTSMNMAMEFVRTMDPEMNFASDGSVEGMISALEARPDQVSLFFRDEMSGFFDSMNKKEYLAGMREFFTHLYDVPDRTFSRVLKKNKVELQRPILIMFGGGVTEAIYGTLNQGYITSGFIPRFIVVSGDRDIDDMRPFDLETEEDQSRKDVITRYVADLYQLYSTDGTIQLAGQKIATSQRFTVVPTREALDFWNSCNQRMLRVAKDSSVAFLATPTFDRLCRSMLKMSMLLAASRQDPVDGKLEMSRQDVVNAAHYVQKWGNNSVELILNSDMTILESKIQNVLRMITNRPGTTRSEIVRNHHLVKKEADIIFETLEDRAQIRKEVSGRGFRYFPIT